MSGEIYQKSISELNNLVTAGEVSSREVTKAFLDRINSHESKLNSFLLVRDGEALKEAEEIDRRIKSGDLTSSLAGIPVAIKNNIATKGLTTDCASKILEGFVPLFSATVVERMKTAGMVTIGKTNLDEFAMGSSTENSAFGTVRNPWDLSRTPGGSSGGSTAAVAAGFSPVALGSETGGSVRQPASFCGVTGLKPTYGRISRYGLVAFGSSLDQIGIVAHSAEEIASLLAVIAGHDDYDSTSATVEVDDYVGRLNDSIKGRKVGLPSEYFREGLNDEVKVAVESFVKVLNDNECEVMEISLPHTDYGIAVYYILAPAEASSNLSRYDGIKYGYRAEGDYSMREIFAVSRDLGFGSEVKRRIMLGTYVLSAGYYDAYYLKAQKVRTLIRQDFESAFDKVDFIVTPTTPTTAFKLGEKIDNPLEMYLSDIYTVNVNLAGLPAISLPVGFDSIGLPIGAQVIGKWFDEGGLLNITHFYQTLTDNHRKFPDMRTETVTNQN